MRRFKLYRVPGKGWRYQSDHGWFYIGIAGEIYAFHMEIGRFSVCFMSKRGKKVEASLEAAS